MKQPFLTGNAIYLRGLDVDDLHGNYANWFNDLEVCKYNSHGLFPSTLKKLENYVLSIANNENNIVFAIIWKENNVHIGNVSLQCIDWISRSAEFAIVIGEKEYWGKGAAQDSAKLILEHGFLRLNLHRIHCGTASDNIAMQKLAAYMGMKQEGLRRDAMYKNGLYKDIVEYGILQDEYYEQNRK